MIFADLNTNKYNKTIMDTAYDKTYHDIIKQII